MTRGLDPVVVGLVNLFRAMGDVIELLEPWCPHCGESWHDPSSALTLDGLEPLITAKCRDWHEVCNQCFERFDQPRGKGCRRRKHPKEVVDA